MIETPSLQNIRHFKGLNELRFIAAFLVVMSHAEGIRNKYNLTNFEWLGLFRNGGNAVTFFFVLSGFLITYLLLKEQSVTHSISIKNFYRNRILRIWPLYFLMVFIGIIILPFVFKLIGYNYIMPYNLDQVWLYFLFFVPGLVTFFYGHHFLEPLWSIGVEEVFYLLWAPVFKILKGNIVLFLYSVILLKVILQTVVLFLPEFNLVKYILSTFQFESMAVGGLGAYYIYHYPKDLNNMRIYKLPFQIAVYSILLIHLVLNTNINNDIYKFIFVSSPISTVVLDCMFLYLIVGSSLIAHSIIKPANKLLFFLGEISYGIYMYQMLAINLTILLLHKYLSRLNVLFGSVLYYVAISVVLIAISYLSKKYFENLFLKYKKHYKPRKEFSNSLN